MISLRSAAVIAGDALGVIVVMLSVPVAILLVGLPVVLLVRLLLWSLGAL